MTLLLRSIALVLLALGLALGGGGVLLLIAGGSPAYIFFGLALCATGVLLWRRSGWSPWVAAALLLGVDLWALGEGGMNIWAYAPRLPMFAVIAAVLALPAIRRRLTGGPAIGIDVGRTLAAAVALVTLAIPCASVIWPNADSATLIATAAPGGGTAGDAAGTEWTSWGGTPAGTRFSALDQITPANVNRLKLAWRYDFHDSQPYGLQVTATAAAGRLYICNSTDVVVALDPDTGRELWKFDPKIDLFHAPFRACRGVGYYAVPNAIGPCATRVFVTTVDARLIALDAVTGRRCKGFGAGGDVELTEGLGKVRPGYYWFNGATTIARDRIVLGATIVDNQIWGEPSGVIRAFDPVTGKLDWAYDVGHPDRHGAPPPGETYTPATPNSWGQMSYDDALGLIYVPTGNATPDYFGGRRRPIDDEISSSVMALDIETGERRWIFQTTHHDVWDYDVGAQPTLFDLQQNGRTVHALAQATKRGEIFLLDRVTGKPIAPVVERPAPQGGASGERLSPTQPFSVGMPSMAGPPLTEARMWGLTPFDQLWCRITFRQSRYDGPMTPPGLKPTLEYPGYLGGMDWGGVSVDTQRGLMVMVHNYVANRVRLVPRAQANAAGAFPMGEGRDGGAALTGYLAQGRTPYAVDIKGFLSPLTVPCQQPPWSRISAIDLASRKVVWSRPLGTGKDNGPHGLASHLPLPMGVPSLGGTLLTRSGLTFVGASTDKTFRAFDTASGRLLWQSALPESGNAIPMTFRSPASGRQFVTIAAGGHKALGSHGGDSFVAYTLP
ncbi:membrane-bound PQQ-dependent dehydrogenase, glucose/quinate/shikimate family [Sphingomonas sp. CGMCC 1.13654]|uniref:Membrane-bound PQQ-dependent dehydrogenase, glucose/quinate/shikimate family n=1 Tax=Sphingomonas chungangi TaxID=2683589 RepID=A0A838L2L0_9SPHN|nr:membrane-bound PQQ-dependent dehydrogenase, glucose/quinate/shikimate family [Sphingomonas chungangi]MBA2933733.1 membrane-bound PQQ-dependent dehydrogenase, glucose/quinate/shikimate family [Sphingomonas chungangi]MVW55064.1 membrane-bound PQQ-dependent dehydrogenase, glucose/quinate/shikimate family [Sphingomonas chungangi]